MGLTTAQREAVDCDGHLMLSACPGSGKTRVIVSKLVRVIEKLRGTPRSVACITYTNAAVYEIETRMRLHLQPDDDRYFDVSTIHSFCLNSIFRPFRHLVPGFKDGFKVLTHESEEFNGYVTATCSKFGRHGLSYTDFEDFTKLRTDLSGNPVGDAIDKGGVTVAMARDFWTRIQKDGFIDFSGILLHSYLLLRDFPHVLNSVSSKFAWILVDEFQDTSDMQVEMLSLISTQNQTTFLLVGDRYQSIFGFAGARPDLANVFAKRIAARTDIQLAENFRSSAFIVGDAERLYSRSPSMKAVGKDHAFPYDSEWCHAESSFQLVTKVFLPALHRLNIPIGNAAVLAPSWAALYTLGRQLRANGVPVVGPGARPYRRSRQFAGIAEAVCGYLLEPRAEAIFSLERTLFHTLLDVTGHFNFDIYTYAGRVMIYRMVEAARGLQIQHPMASGWLDAAAVDFTAILTAEGFLGPADIDVFPASVSAMKRDMVANKVDINALSLDDLGIYASPNSALKLTTIHTSKGREYDAVVIVDLREGAIPSYYAKTSEALDEQKRLFYVGVTRAKKYLLYGTSLKKDQPSRFLFEEGIGFHRP